MMYVCDILFLFLIFIIFFEKYFDNLLVSLFLYGLVIVIFGRSLYDVVVMERRDNIYCLIFCVRIV